MPYAHQTFTTIRLKLSALLACLLLSLFVVSGCTNDSSDDTIPPSVTLDTREQKLDWMMDHAQDYLNETAFRRAEIERMLWRPELGYAKKILDHYALGQEGWDRLPELELRVSNVLATPDDTWHGERLDTLDVDPEQLTRAQWISLGERVFQLMPMRRDAYLAWLAKNPQHWEDVGLTLDPDTGAPRGFVRYKDPRGRLQVGISCAACHNHDDTPGRGDTAINLGLARALYRDARSLPRAPFDTWGPGKVDVTSDSVNDPVKIPNLWGAPYQRHINSSGVIQNHSPATFAVRFETQYILNHNFEARPKRHLMWALGMYMISLRSPASPATSSPQGEQIYDASCAGCHDQSNDTLIPYTALHTEPLSATSARRGTGFYRAPHLTGLHRGGPFFHDASAASLQDVLAIHPTPDALSDTQRDALLTHLNSL